MTLNIPENTGVFAEIFGNFFAKKSGNFAGKSGIFTSRTALSILLCKSGSISLESNSELYSMAITFLSSSLVHLGNRKELSSEVGLNTYVLNIYCDVHFKHMYITCHLHVHTWYVLRMYMYIHVYAMCILCMYQ